VCGIFGYIGSVKQGKNEDLLETIQAIAISSECRGIDSTGFTAWWNRGSCVNYKEVTRPANFVFKDSFTSIFQEPPLIFMGHNRMASRGSVTYVNAHPFEGDRYTLAHNGTSNGSADKLEKEHGLNCVGETDSERFLCYLEKYPGKMKGLLESIDNYALEILDKQEGVLYFARDEYRPIYIIDMRETLGVRIWASTRDILKNGLELAGWEKITGVLNKGFHPNSFTLYSARPDTGELEKQIVYKRKPVEYHNVNRELSALGGATSFCNGRALSWNSVDDDWWDRGKSFNPPKIISKSKVTGNDEKLKALKPTQPQKAIDKGVSIKVGDRFEVSTGGTVKVQSFMDSSTAIMLREEEGVCYMEPIRIIMDAIRTDNLTPISTKKRKGERT